MQTIFAKLLYEMEKGRDTVLTTIVWESGSAPRGAGAQMLVDAQGPQAGTIGGGNVENLSILHARELLKAGHGDIRDYKPSTAATRTTSAWSAAAMCGCCSPTFPQRIGCGTSWPPRFWIASPNISRAT